MQEYNVCCDIMGSDPGRVLRDFIDAMPDVIEAESLWEACRKARKHARRIVASWDPRTTGLDCIAVSVYPADMDSEEWAIYRDADHPDYGHPDYDVFPVGSA